jgi:glutathione S-transferase
MSEFLLYGNRHSGHSYKVKLALSVAQVPHRYEEIDIFVAREARPEPFRSLARYGEVPVLMHDGQALIQSNAILCHLAEYLKAYGGESAVRMDRVREWLLWESNRIGFSLAHLRFARKFEPEAYPGGTMEWIERRFDIDIARLEQELTDGRAFILGDMPCVADFSLCGYMFWPEHAQVSFPAHVTAWLERISKLPGWQHPEELMRA